MGPAATPGASPGQILQWLVVNVTRCDILRQNWESISNMWGAIQGSWRPAAAFQLEFPRTAITVILQSAVKAQTQHV